MRLKARGENSGDATFSDNAKGKGGSSTNEDKKKKKGKRKFQGKCFYCKKKGHAIAECCTKKADEKNNNLKPNIGKESVTTIEVKLDLFVVTEEVCSSAQDSSVGDSWVLDSGASRHMTNKKGLYSSMRPL